MTPSLRPIRATFASLLRAFAEVKLLGVLLAANLAVALIVSLPFLVPALQLFGHSLSANGQPFPSVEALSDFGKELAQGNGGGFIAGGIAVSLLLSLFQQLLFAGGIASRVWTGGRFSLAEFASQCARLLGRNARLMLWALPGLAVAVGIAAGAAALLNKLELPTLFTLKGYMWAMENPFSGWATAHLALVVLLYALWRGSLDVARVAVLAEDQRKTRVAAWRALRRMATSPGALLGYIAVGLLGLGLVVALMHLRAAIDVTTAGKAWLALLVGQLVIVGRLAASVATLAFAAEVHRAPPRPVAVPASAPELAVVPQAPASADAPPAAPEQEKSLAG